MEFRGCSEHQTFFGGLISIVFYSATFLFFIWRTNLMLSRGRDLLMSVTFFRDLEKEDPYPLKNSEVKIWTNFGDADFDNNDNPYIKIKTHYYSNMEGEDSQYSHPIEMVECDHEYVTDEVKQLWYPGKFYCPEWTDEHVLHTNYNYVNHTWFRVAVHYCNEQERAQIGKTCAPKQEIEDYLDKFTYSLSYQQMAPDLTEFQNFSRKYYYLPIYSNPPSHETVRAQEFYINKDKITLEDRMFGVFDFEDNH